MAREVQAISTTRQLAEAVGYTHLQARGGGRKRDKAQIHPATRTFQVSRAMSSAWPSLSVMCLCVLGMPASGGQQLVSALMLQLVLH